MKSKKLVWVLFGVLICMLFSGCNMVTQEENAEEQDEELLEEDASLEYEYPIVLTPTLTGEIEAAIESEDIFCVYNGEKYGYITKSGEEITDYIYDMAYPFSEGLACVLLDGKFGFIDTEGKEAIPFIYDDAAPFSEGLAYFATEEEYGFINAEGVVSFYLDCDSVSSFSEGLAYYSIDGKYGYINQQNQFVIDASYSDADYFKNGLAFVSIDGYVGAINTSGEVIIPIDYVDIYRTDYYIYASKSDSDAYEYFDFEGNPITGEQAENLYAEGTENSERLAELTTNEAEGVFTVLDNKGRILLTMECEFVSEDIYQNYNNVILKNYGHEYADSIVLIEEQKDVDLSKLILKNSITPKKKLYWELLCRDNTEVNIAADENVITSQEFDTWYAEEYIKTAKLYDINQTGNPLLYCMEKPLNPLGLPMSDSAIYGEYNDRLYSVVTGNECGGSARGHYTCFYKEADTGEIYVGVNGEVGGFGGMSNYGEVYYYGDGIAIELLSWEWICQTTGNYDEAELLENANMFYCGELPHTEKTMQDAMQNAEMVEEYRLYDARVTYDAYYETKNMYREITLFIN